MANKDLRDWISALEAAGDLKVIKGAEPREEIGGIVDIYMRSMGNPAVMFDEVPGYPKGRRVIANILTSVPRINVALGLPPQASEMELIQWWRNYMKHAPSHKARSVNGATCSRTFSRARTSISRRYRPRSGTRQTAAHLSARPASS